MDPLIVVLPYKVFVLASKYVYSIAVLTNLRAKANSKDGTEPFASNFYQN